MKLDELDSWTTTWWQTWSLLNSALIVRHAFTALPVSQVYQSDDNWICLLTPRSINPSDLWFLRNIIYLIIIIIISKNQNTVNLDKTDTKARARTVGTVKTKVY